MVFHGYLEERRFILSGRNFMTLRSDSCDESTLDECLQSFELNVCVYIYDLKYTYIQIITKRQKVFVGKSFRLGHIKVVLKMRDLCHDRISYLHAHFSTI